MQHLLTRAKWDADTVRDDLRGYVTVAFADPDAVLVVDETGALKKGCALGPRAAPVHRHRGRIEKAQVAVFLTYATRRGHALIDRTLYLPQSWVEDPDRCRAAGIPEGVQFATKPALAASMITRAVTAGAPACLVAGDEVYGGDPRLRAAIRGLGLGYVLQVAANQRMPTAIGPRRVDELAANLPATAWERRSAGAGSKGPRYYSARPRSRTKPRHRPRRRRSSPSARAPQRRDR